MWTRDFDAILLVTKVILFVMTACVYAAHDLWIPLLIMAIVYLNMIRQSIHDLMED